jgi:hypothetical protein
MRTGRQKKKLRLANGQPPTAREREPLTLFRVMNEPDWRLILSTAERLISSQAASESRTPER